MSPFNLTQDQSTTCWNYVRGNCTRRKCKYVHPQGVCFPPYNRSSPFGLRHPVPLPTHLDDIVEDHNATKGAEGAGPAVYYKHIAWKTAPCRHFMKTGDCPLGEKCRFIHDVELLRAEASNPIDENPDNSTRSHCWSFVQGWCKNASCRYLHPVNVKPYKKYTPCLAWPMCPYGSRCDFKHPEPMNGQSATKSTRYNPLAGLSAPASQSSSSSFAPTSPNEVSPWVPTQYYGTTFYLPSPPLQFSPFLSPPRNTQFMGDREASYFKSVPMGPAVMTSSDCTSLPYRAQGGTPASVSPPMELSHKENHNLRAGIKNSNINRDILRSTSALSSSKNAGHSNTITSTRSGSRFSHARRISVSIKNPSRIQ